MIKNFIRGSIPGALAGLIYAVLEYALVIVRPMVQWRSAALPPEHWEWEVTFLCIYVFFGALIGGVLAIGWKSNFPAPGKRFAIAAGVAAAAAVVLVIWTVALNAAPPLPRPKGAPVARSSRPNVLLIVLDTVRADHLSLYGYARRTTPNLEALAREGVWFRNAVSAADVTLSSHGSIFTGLYPSWHGAHPHPGNDLGRLEPSFHTLAEILSENGYATFAVLANYGYLRPEFGMAQGFAFYDVRSPVPTSPETIPYLPRNFLRPLIGKAVSTAELDRLYRRADQITDGGLRVLDFERGQPAPFFLSLNYMDAHEPYSPPRPFRDAFPGRDPAFDNRRIGALRKKLAVHQHPGDAAATLGHIVSQYDGAISFMDAEVQRLFEGMKRAGTYDNTLIIVTSDHGEALGERDDLGHPASVHRELVHVPLIIKYPRSAHFDKSQCIDATVSGVDLLPTVLETVGIAAPPGIQGQSVQTLASNSGRTVISESFLDEHLLRLHLRSDLVQRALYRDHWKYIGSTGGQKELYDLDRDPTESRNLYDPGDPVSLQFSDNLNRWIQSLPRTKVMPKMDAKTRERLKSLGYIQ